MAAQTANQTMSDVRPEVVMKGDMKYMRLVAPLGNYGADDIMVRPAEDKLLLLDRNDTVLQTFSLPESVDPFSVEADVSDDGMLTVLAPLKC